LASLLVNFAPGTGLSWSSSLSGLNGDMKTAPLLEAVGTLFILRRLGREGCDKWLWRTVNMRSGEVLTRIRGSRPCKHTLVKGAVICMYTGKDFGVGERLEDIEGVVHIIARLRIIVRSEDGCVVGYASINQHVVWYYIRQDAIR